MDTTKFLLEADDNLPLSHMICKGIIVFIFALLLIRISGRRSLGMKSPLDNIIAMTLGAVLSRAIVGASALVPVLATCFMIVLIHRFLGWITSAKPAIGKFLEGEKVLIFEQGIFLEHNLKRVLLNRNDVMTGVREAACTESMNNIDKVYMEHNGKITVIKKES